MASVRICLRADRAPPMCPVWHPRAGTPVRNEAGPRLRGTCWSNPTSGIVMSAEPERRTAAYVACLALAVVCCACACGSAPADHLVVLADDRGLQPAENIVPLVRRDVVARYGPRLLAVLDTVSARLTTGSLRALGARVELRGQDPRLVAGVGCGRRGCPLWARRCVERAHRPRGRRKWPGQLAAGPGGPQGPPSSPPDRRAAAAAAPVRCQHRGVAVLGAVVLAGAFLASSTRRGSGLMTGSVPGSLAGWRGCGRRG